MALDGTAEETPVEVAVEETPIEQPVETVADEPKVESEESPVEEPVPAEEIPTEEVVEPLVFDAKDETLAEKTTEVLEKYEIPQEVQAVIDVYKAKAEAPQDDFAEYAEYGDTEAVKSLLDDHSLVYTADTDEAGNIRPNTHKFAQKVFETDPEKAQWLHYDLARLPSQKYQGLNLFEEGIADALAVQGDTVGSVLDRYRQTIAAVKSGATISSDAPAFIHPQLRDAYWSLSKEDREEIDALNPEYDRIEENEYGKFVNVDEPLRLRKLDTLAKIQKGIDSDKTLNDQLIQTREQRNQEFSSDVISTQVRFYDAFRNTFTQDLIKDVEFSTDPKMQTLLAHQNVTLLTQAFDDDSTGEYARKALAESGISFDKNKADQLTKDIELAAIALTTATRQRGANPIEFNKATKRFETAGRQWQAFASDMIQQMAELTSTGTTKAVEEAATKQIEKKKIEPKGRASTNGASSAVKKNTEVRPPANIPYASKEWDKWWADQTIREKEAKRASAYQ